MTLYRINRIISRGDGSDAVSTAYDVIMLVSIVASIVPLMFMNDYPVFRYIEIVTVSVFIIDYIARWMTYPIRSGKGKKSLLYYPFTPMAIIDMLSIVPVVNLIDKSFKLFRVTRLLRIFRVFKLFRYSKKVEMLGHVLYKERHLLSSVLAIAVFYIFITALVMFNVEPHVNAETGEYVFHSFFDALYWAAVTLTTVGYGDLCPVTDLGRTVSILSSIFGVAVIALPSGIITASYMEELQNERKNR